MQFFFPTGLEDDQHLQTPVQDRPDTVAVTHKMAHAVPVPTSADIAADIPRQEVV